MTRIQSQPLLLPQTDPQQWLAILVKNLHTLHSPQQLLLILSVRRFLHYLPLVQLPSTLYHTIHDLASAVFSSFSLMPLWLLPY